ncbi:MAG: hypothetical protein JW768_05445 [Chitinispirillaceae bacterium]|nr:hypothetical protein [Chitinispirillaceae bacterium]
MAHSCVKGAALLAASMLLPFLAFAQERPVAAADTMKPDSGRGAGDMELSPQQTITPLFAVDTAVKKLKEDTAKRVLSTDTSMPSDTSAKQAVVDTLQRLTQEDTVMTPAVSGTAVRPAVTDTMPQPVRTDTTEKKAAARTVPGKLAIPARPRAIGDTLAGNLPRLIKAQNRPYLVASDIYVPSGRTVTIEPGTVLLFRNFSGLHVEGQLLVEGTEKSPVIFSSELDKDFNAGARLHANPYDWNGIIIHESGLGSVLSHCLVRYTVYGINSHTRYIKIAQVMFSRNGRGDLTIEGMKHPVADRPYSYALTISDAKKDGVPVAVLMDPNAKRRNLLRYAGFSLFAGGMTWGVWSMVLLGNDQKELDRLSSSEVTDEQSNLVKHTSAEYDEAKRARDRSRGLTVTGFTLAILGGAGFAFSFTF